MYICIYCPHHKQISWSMAAYRELLREHYVFKNRLLEWNDHDNHAQPNDIPDCSRLHKFLHKLYLIYVFLYIKTIDNLKC